MLTVLLWMNISISARRVKSYDSGESQESRYEAILTIFETNDFGEVVESIRLTDSRVEYLFAEYSSSNPQCSEFVDKHRRCGQIVWGTSGYIATRTHIDSEGIRTRFIKELISELMELKPFDLTEGTQSYRPSQFAVTFRMTEFGTGSTVLRKVKVSDYQYNPWDRSRPLYRICDFMRRMKAYVSLGPEIWSRAKAEEQIISELETESPYREVIRKAALVELWRTGQRGTLPELEKVLTQEKDTEIRGYIREIVRAWKAAIRSNR